MIEFVTYLAKELVDQTREVVVTETTKGNTVVYTLKVNAQDLGKIIGKNGANFQAMQTLLTSVSVKYSKRGVLKLDTSA